MAMTVLSEDGGPELEARGCYNLKVSDFGLDRLGASSQTIKCCA